MTFPCKSIFAIKPWYDVLGYFLGISKLSNPVKEPVLLPTKQPATIKFVPSKLPSLKNVKLED